MIDHPSDQERPWVAPTLTGLTGLLAVLILVQAALAGQFLFGDGTIDVHGYLGNGSFALGVAIVGVALVGRASRVVLVLAVLLLVALFTQIGLGYAGRTSSGAAAWHIPGGVTSLGLVTSLLTAVLIGTRRSPGPRQPV